MMREDLCEASRENECCRLVDTESNVSQRSVLGEPAKEAQAASVAEKGTSTVTRQRTTAVVSGRRRSRRTLPSTARRRLIARRSKRV